MRKSDIFREFIRIRRWQNEWKLWDFLWKIDQFNKYIESDFKWKIVEYRSFELYGFIFLIKESKFFLPANKHSSLVLFLRWLIHHQSIRFWLDRRFSNRKLFKLNKFFLICFYDPLLKPSIIEIIMNTLHLLRIKDICAVL